MTLQSSVRNEAGPQERGALVPQLNTDVPPSSPRPFTIVRRLTVGAFDTARPK